MADQRSQSPTHPLAAGLFEPNEAQKRAYRDIRSAGMDLVERIVAYCPPCADTTAAIRKVREAVMTANAAIALSLPVDEIGESPAAV